jgi:hypothetical protein
MKRVMFLLCGLCWFAFGLVTGAFAWRNLADDTGIQRSGFRILAPVSSGSVMIGLVHVMGFFLLAVSCIVIGLGLWVYSFESNPADGQKLEPPKQP